MSDGPSIDDIAAELDADWVTLRQDIHRWPELAGDERRTAALAAERLRAAGLAVASDGGGHGVVAILDGAHSGPTIAYRADMDAVAAEENPVSDFASRVRGAAHLCGHDLHTAIGVGIGQVLARLRHHLSGRIVFVFQPAEETLEGARAMLQTDVFQRTAPAEIYALHCSSLAVGTFAVMPGVGQPGLDRFVIEFSGPAAAADGQQLVAAINALSTVRHPRTPEDFRQLLDDLQLADGPLARFVVAGSSLNVKDGRATVRGWLRAWPDDRYAQLRHELQRLVEPLGGARLEFPASPFPAMVCSPELSEAAAAYLRSTLGAGAVKVLHASFPFNGEDFALFLQQMPGAMIFLGVANSEAGIEGVPHRPDFAPDERAIGIGVRAMAGLLSHRVHALRG